LSEDAFYYSVQNLLLSSSLSKNMKLKVYGTIMLPLLCVGVKLLTYIERGTLSVFETRALRRICGPKRD
jgi:hypothetical protein